MNTTIRNSIGGLALWSALILVLQPATVRAQGTAFTYQGRLDDSGQPANGLYDFRAQVYNRATPGEPGDALVSSTLTFTTVPVTNGLFSLTLDFGAGPFNGEARWLLLAVRTNGAPGYQTLLPRQPVTPTPYAIRAANLSGAIPANQVTGTLATASLPTGGNWALTSTLTLDSTTLAIDPVNNRVGIGTSLPSTALTVATGIGYGIEHTDGTRRLSTFLDEGGCWLGSVSADKLNFFVNNGVSSLTVDLAGRVGIGTTSPSWPLQVVAGQSVVRLDSTANAFGSVLELRNNTASPTYLGAINFNNAAGTYPGQIGYYANDALTFRVAGAQRMELLGNGQLSVFGTSTRGVYAESSASGGIGVFGFAGPSGSASLGNGNTGVYGESAQNNGNGVVGVANNGTSAFGVWGKSTSGFAGAFDGAVKIYGNSSHTKPFLQLHESEDGDYARIQLQVANRPLWHISVGGPDNSLVFYNSTNSIVSSLSESGTLTTRVLTITGGADIAEPFAMSQPDLPKGAVVVIDEAHPGHLKLSTEPYDRRVAGVISGAGGVNPGLSLSQQGVLEGNQQVALTGRVYVQADASSGPIQPGDLLTTSATPGHAMKAADPTRAHGAILGKAMTGLKEGKGLVLVLVALQ